jgi:AcrR family transcriptional regulator
VDLHERRRQPYDAISVKEILDRADVGRSTFYTHYRDKDELLVSAIHDLLASVQSDNTPSSAKRSERMLGFSLPIFEHVDQHRRAGDAGIGAKDRARFHDHLRGVLAELIAEDVAKGCPPREGRPVRFHTPSSRIPVRNLRSRAELVGREPRSVAAKRCQRRVSCAGPADIGDRRTVTEKSGLWRRLLAATSVRLWRRRAGLQLMRLRHPGRLVHHTQHRRPACPEEAPDE